MARQRESHIRRQITSLISPQLIRRRGRDLGVVQRQRKVDIVAQHIMDVGGSFLCRVKKDANFVVLRSADPRLIGNRTKDILRRMRGRNFECAVDYMHRNIPQRDWTQNHIDLRLVAIWNRQRKYHQQYLSNVSPDQLAAADMPAVYSMRWEIELLFRELKSQLSIDQIPSGNKAAADACIYAALLVLAIGRKLHRALQCRGKSLVDRFPFERWSSILRQVASDLLYVLLAPASQSRSLSRRLALLLRYEGKDPNRHRCESSDHQFESIELNEPNLMNTFPSESSGNAPIVQSPDTSRIEWWYGAIGRSGRLRHPKLGIWQISRTALASCNTWQRHNRMRLASTFLGVVQ